MKKIKIITGIIVIGLIIALIYNISQWTQEKKAREENEEVVVGIIIKSKSFVHRGSNEIVSTVQYYVEGKEYERVFNTFSLGLTEGDSCKLIYEVGNPKNSSLYKEKGN